MLMALSGHRNLRSLGIYVQLTDPWFTERWWPRSWGYAGHNEPNELKVISYWYRSTRLAMAASDELPGSVWPVKTRSPGALSTDRVSCRSITSPTSGWCR